MQKKKEIRSDATFFQQLQVGTQALCAPKIVSAGNGLYLLTLITGAGPRVVVRPST